MFRRPISLFIDQSRFKIFQKTKKHCLDDLIQRQIINKIQTSKYENLFRLFERLKESFFSTCSLEFLSNDHLKNYLKTYPYLELLRLIQIYLSKNDVKNEVLMLKSINKIVNGEYNGTFIRLSDRADLANPNFIRYIYLSKDEKLIQLFQEFFPRLRPEVLYGLTLPDSLVKRELEETKTIIKHLTSDFKIEKIATRMQREYRRKKRLAEEFERINYKYYRLISSEKITASSIMDAASKPYFPKKCKKELAQRIYDAAKTIQLFSTIRHVTSINSLKSILNDGLYGRQTLEKFNMKYEPAALSICDVSDGDANVICFGINKIDIKNMKMKSNKVEITLDFKKIDKSNKCIFYKQQDLGYALDEKRILSIGSNQLLFCHTEKKANSNYSYLSLWDKDNIRYSSYLPKCYFIAYDIFNIHAILIMNFFRFLDDLYCITSHNSDAMIADIYSKIASLTDSELLSFLKELGTQMSDTAEFNFFGAHKIDLDTIANIKNFATNFTLDMPLFIKKLQNNDISALNEVKKHLPQLLESYRFLDYLLSKNPHQNIKLELTMQRKNCILPFWLEAHEKKCTEESQISLLQTARSQNVNRNPKIHGCIKVI